MNDYPNLLSYCATFRMEVLLPNDPEENVVKGENVPNIKVNTGTSCGTSDGTFNIFQILQDLYRNKEPHSTSTIPIQIPIQYPQLIQHRWKLLSGPSHPQHKLQQQSR